MTVGTSGIVARPKQRKLNVPHHTHTVRKTAHQLEWENRKTEKKLEEQKERKVKRDNLNNANAIAKHERRRRIELDLLRESWNDNPCPFRRRVDEMIVAAPPYFGNSDWQDSGQIYRAI